MELYVKIPGFRWLIIFIKSVILDVGIDSEYAFADSNSWLISSKIEASDLFANKLLLAPSYNKFLIIFSIKKQPVWNFTRVLRIKLHCFLVIILNNLNKSLKEM